MARKVICYEGPGRLYTTQEWVMLWRNWQVTARLYDLL